MRVSANGRFLRQESSKPRIDPKPRYFLAFEGIRTEYQYFSGIRDKQESLGITALQDITLLQRHATKENHSNPAVFLPQVIQSLEEYHTGHYHVTTIVEHAVDWLILHNHLPKKGCRKQQMWDGLLEKLDDDGYSPDEVVRDRDALIQTLRNHLIDLYTTQISNDALKAFHTYLKQQFLTYNPRYDKACVIIDRDPESFTSAQYDRILTLCCEKKISLHLSNPCFEFWLLLHFPVVFELEPQELLANKKITRTKRFLEVELQKINTSFQKNHLRFEMFEEHIDTAIENEASFCEDIAALKTELGSNVGKLLSELKSASEIEV